MKVFEIFSYQPQKPEVDFDLHDDLMFFMNNDPEFYRHQYYPFLHKFNNHCSSGRNVAPTAFKPIVIKAYENYKKKFQLPELEKNLKESDLDDICEKLQSQELKNYHDLKQKQQEKKNESA